ncbi:MAG TPA: AraC family transcriptional regulator [Planctomycetota bacterium]|nr:AraC family transcriptional regulator [Planctomycetota bacterium]
MRIYIHEGLSAERPVSAGRWNASPHVSAQHVHDNLELLWNERPLILNIGGERIELEQPRLVLIPPLTPHIAEPVGKHDPAELSGCHVSVLEGALLGAPDQPTLKAGPVEPEDNAILLPLVKHLHRRLLQNRNKVPIDQKLLTQGLIALLRDLGYGSTARPIRNLDPVQRALEELYARFHEPDLHIQDLARAADLSLAQFRRVFKQVIGEPPLSYLARHRLEQARMLLIQDKLTVAAVARRVGFNSPGSFYERFMKAYGHSPRNKSKKAILKEVARSWAPPGTYRKKKTTAKN